MTTFYIGALSLTVIALIFAVWPFLRRPKGASVEAFVQERQATNVDSFRDQLLELEAQFKQGNIEQAQYEETKAELERSLLNDNVPVADAKVAKFGRLPKLFYWLIVFILMPFMVLSIYQMLGSKDTVVLSEKIAQKNALEQQWLTSGDESLEQALLKMRQELIVDLEQHISETPEDLDSHVLLAREAMNVGLFKKAIQTYQVIVEKEPTAAQMVAELAQAIFVQEERRAIPLVGVLAERAVELQPNNMMALEIAGISAFQNQQFELAITRWQQAVNLRPEGPTASALRNGIEQAKMRLAAVGEEGALLEASPAQAESEPASTEALAQPSLTVTVSLGDQVAVKPEAAVFIYARAWQGAKVPLAISRVKVSDLPITVTLDNSMSMAPGMNLSTVQQVELLARVSESGTAVSQAGDWQAAIGPIEVATSAKESFNLVIDTLYQP